MASLLRRLTSLAVVIALSGSPAVLSACMALCLQGVATAASDRGSQSEGHATHTSVATPAVASAHAHHGSPAPNESTAPAATPSPQDYSDVRLSAICTDCCPDGQVVLAAGRGVDRTDAKSFSPAPTVALAASFLLTTSGHGVPPPSPPGPPPASPTRAPLVLRI